MSDKICPDCGDAFDCNVDGAIGACWCNDFPNILSIESQQDCRCPSCLAKAIALQIDAVIKATDRDQMIEVASQYRGQDTLVEHIDYVIENGRTIFSQWYHLKRGNCCGCGCINCPYSL